MNAGLESKPQPLKKPVKRDLNSSLLFLSHHGGFASSWLPLREWNASDHPFRSRQLIRNSFAA